MLVKSLVPENTWSSKQGDTVADAVALMEEVRESELPVVDEEGRLVGMLTAAIVEKSALNQPVGSLHLEPRYAINGDAHFYDAVTVVLMRNLQVLPVVDGDDIYLGLLTRRLLFSQCARELGIHLPGAVLEIEMKERDYAVGKLAHAIEQSNTRILSLATDSSSPDDGVTRITVKIDTGDATRVRHMLEHYGIRVIASFNERMSDADLELRVREFMRYLEV
jgi:signal-transduction protein with cAMP-binding, CBS, and nucleotidyltransferase domain